MAKISKASQKASIRFVQQRQIVKLRLHGATWEETAEAVGLQVRTCQRRFDTWRETNKTIPKAARARFDQIDSAFEDALGRGDIPMIRALSLAWWRAANLLGEDADAGAEGAAEVRQDAAQYLRAIAEAHARGDDGSAE